MAVVPSADTSATQAMLDRLHPFASHDAGSVVPPGFAAYARILHPGDGVRWSEVAAWSGRTYHPAMQFEAIATRAGNPPARWNGNEPYCLPLAQAAHLAQILREFTTTPETIWYAVWEGYGNLGRAFVVNTGGTGSARWTQYGFDRSAFGPRVGRVQRHYYVFRGSLADAAKLDIGRNFHQPADYWFPDDGAWCVATDVDLFWTYVASTAACAAAVLASPELEAVSAQLTDSLVFNADPVNRLSAEEWALWSHPGADPPNN